MTPLPTLDDPALADFLRRNHRAFLFCRDEGGNPIGYAMRSITYEPGRLYFATYTKSAKVRHLLADPGVACVVADSFDAIGGVIARGRSAAADTTAPRPVVALTTARTDTFSFASRRREPEKSSGTE